MSDTLKPLGREARVDALIEAALEGDLAGARELLAADPGLTTATLYSACALGEVSAVEDFLASDSSLARAKGGPRAREPLLYVCFSRFLGADGQRADGLVVIARTLLARGADPNAYFTVNDDPSARQTALYGAAGVNNHARLTRLLLEAGADPNDAAPGPGPESLYHACEFSDPTCLRLLLEARPHPDKVSYCFARKLDFEDYDGAKLFLDHGADPNFVTPFGEHWTRLHHAVARGRSTRIVALLLERGADVTIHDASGHTPYALAVRFGRVEVAALLRARGATDADLSELDRFLGACARGDEAPAREALANHPELLTTLTESDRGVLTDAAWHGRTEAVRAMLAVGFDAAGIGPHGTTPLHHAAFMGQLEVVKLLLSRRPPLELRDAVYQGTPLEWALAGSRGSETNPAGDYVAVVEALLAAGAQVPDRPRGRSDVQATVRTHAARSPGGGPHAAP